MNVIHTILAGCLLAMMIVPVQAAYRVTFQNGKAQMTGPTGPTKELKVGDQILDLSTIRTDAKSQLILEGEEGSLKLEENSEIQFDKYFKSIILELGSAIMKVNKRSPNDPNSMQVRTRQVSISVRGTQFAVTAPNPEQGLVGSSVAVHHGTVVVEDLRLLKQRVLEAGQSLLTTANGQLLALEENAAWTRHIQWDSTAPLATALFTAEIKKGMEQALNDVSAQTNYLQTLEKLCKEGSWAICTFLATKQPSAWALLKTACANNQLRACFIDGRDMALLSGTTPAPSSEAIQALKEKCYLDDANACQLLGKLPLSSAQQQAILFTISEPYYEVTVATLLKLCSNNQYYACKDLILLEQEQKEQPADPAETYTLFKDKIESCRYNDDSLSLIVLPTPRKEICVGQATCRYKRFQWPVDVSCLGSNQTCPEAKTCVFADSELEVITPTVQP